MRIVYLHCAEEVERQIDSATIKEKTLYTADKYLVDRLESNNHEVKLVEYSENFAEEIKKINPDYIFNGADALEGGEAYDKLFTELESLDIPFSGCNKEIVNLFTDKVKAKEFFKKCGAILPECRLITDVEQKIDLEFPLIIKPVDTDASEGIDEDSVVYSEEALRKKLAEVLPKFHKVFVDKYINGREFCVPVLFSYGKAEILPILEIDFTEHFEDKPKILSYKAKWSRNTNAFKNTYSIVKQIEPEIEAKIKETALKVFSKINSSGYATMDIRFDNEAYVLEVNPNPYLAVECDFIKSAKSIGLSSNELMDKIVNLTNPETIKIKEKN